MRKSISTFLFATMITCFLIGGNGEENLKSGFIVGSPEIMSIKTLAFGPEDILFLGDNDAMKIYAIDMANEFQQPSNKQVKIQGFDKKLASKLGVAPSEMNIIDMTIRPGYSNIFVSTSVEQDGKSYYTLFMVKENGSISEITLKEINYSVIEITDAPNTDAELWRNKSRTYTFTDMGFANGEVIVSGLSNEEFASSLRRIKFPFQKEYSTTGLQVYHVSHGKNETHAPIYRFLPYNLENRMYIIAGYLCTPLVTFELDDLQDGKKLVGTTVAELGAGNGPHGIVGYNYKGKEYILVGNSRHPLMKFEAKELVNAKSLKYPTRERGVKRETYKEGSIRFLFDYSEDYLMLVNKESDDSYTLRTLSKSKI